MAGLLGVSIVLCSNKSNNSNELLLQSVDDKIIKVVLTGGPCGGKTTSLSEMKKTFVELGYNVFTVPETATLMFENGCKMSYSSNNKITKNEE